MRRIDALTMLNQHLKNRNLLKHSFAAESAMIAICKYLNSDATQDMVDTWAITGLLHDADYEETFNNPEKHGLLTSQKIALPDEIAHAIASHNYQYTNVLPESQLDWAIATCDQLTGLIVASTLVHPTKKLSGVDPDFILKRFYDKTFAKGCDRKNILKCEEKLGIPLLKYIEITLTAMRNIAPELEL